MSPICKACNIIWLESCDSTNKELRRRLEGLDNLSIIAAKWQSEGRGQGNHTWYSPASDNLTFSILYRYDSLPLNATDAIAVTCITALALTDYLAEKGVESRIKWPNDILVGNRKICGILIENILDSSTISCSIVGIGLNLNTLEWPSNLPQAVSLANLLGKQFDPAIELEEISKKVRRRFAQNQSNSGRLSLQEEFEKKVFRL